MAECACLGSGKDELALSGSQTGQTAGELVSRRRSSSSLRGAEAKPFQVICADGDFVASQVKLNQGVPSDRLGRRVSIWSTRPRFLLVHDSNEVVQA